MGGAIYYLVNFVLHSRNKHFGATWYFGVSEKDPQNRDPGDKMNPMTHLENDAGSVISLTKNSDFLLPGSVLY